jgi:hypothetical protein
VTTPVRSALAGSRIVSRSRLLSWLVAIVCVVVAAVGLQVSEPEESVDTTTGLREEALRFGDGSVTVTTVGVGDALDTRWQLVRTSGMFVVVTVTLAAEGRNDLRLTSFRLLSGDRIYHEYELEALAAAPGFAQTDDLLFEVDPRQIDDLTIELGTSEVLHGFHQRLRVHLGITPDNAQAWRDAARGQIVEPGRPSDRALP